MAGGRGLSLEEKRAKLIELFHETKDFYTLKELEKLGAKKGVVSQTVKDVLQTLVDDNLVELDKIGTSNFYWSFPSAQGAALGNKLAATRNEIIVLESRRLELQAAKELGLSERLESDERAALLETWTTLKNSLSDNKLALALFSNSSGIDAKKRAVILAREAAHRWTDNISTALSYLSSTYGIAVQDARTATNVPEDFEDLPAD